MPRSSFTAVVLVPLVLSGCSLLTGDLNDRFEKARMAGFNEFRNDRFDQAIANYRTAIEAQRQLDGNSPKVAQTLNDLARVFLANGQFQAALSSYKEALELLSRQPQQNAQESDVQAARCEALVGLANSLNSLGKDDEAESYYVKALNQAKSGQLGPQLRNVTFAYQSFLRRHGQALKAQTLGDQTELARQVSEPLPQSGAQSKYQMDSHLRLGDQELASNDLDKAQAEYKIALAGAEQGKDPIAIANCASRLGQLAIKQEQWNVARSWFGYAMKYYHKGHADTVTRRAAVSGIAVAFCKLKNYPQAEFCANQLIDDSRRINSKDGHEMREGLEELVNIYQDSGQTAKVIGPMTLMLKNYKQYGPLTMPGPTMTSCYLANQYWMIGSKDKTRKVVDDYVCAALQSGAQELELPGRLLDDYAEVLVKSKAADEARIFLEAARRLLKKASDARQELKRNQQLETQARAAS